MTRRALILANGTFVDNSIPPLASPKHDAARLGELLGKESVGGYIVCLCTDPDLLMARRQIHRFFDDCQYGDVVLMLISGHGIKDRGGRLHFATRDTELCALTATSLDARYVVDCIDECAASKKIVFIDTCYSGAFGKEAASPKAATLSISRDDFSERDVVGKAIITASTSVQIAREMVVENRSQSEFTRHIITGIESGKADSRHSGQISLGDLFHYVVGEMKLEGSPQTPQPYYFGIDGSTVVALNPTRGPSKAFTISDVLDHRKLDDILSLDVPTTARQIIPDFCTFVEDFLAGGSVPQGYRHSASWVAGEILDNCLAYAPLRSAQSVELKVQAGKDGVVISVTQPDDCNFDLDAILSNPNKSQSFMQLMKRGGVRWHVRRYDGRMEVGLYLRFDKASSNHSDQLLENNYFSEPSELIRKSENNGIFCLFYESENALIACLKGVINDSTITGFQDALAESVELCRSLGHRLLILDLAHINYLPSRGLRAFTLSMRMAAPLGIEIVLGRPGAELREILAISRYDRVFTVVSG